MKIIDYLRQLSEVPFDDRMRMVESINIQNYGSSSLSETDMWILRTAADNAEYLEKKLKEADDLTLDKEAPSENDEELTLDEPKSDDELSLEKPTSSDKGDELSLDEPDDDSDDLSLDEPDDDDLSLDDNSEKPKESDKKDKEEIETSVEGAGILPLLAEIQDKLANGKPSEMELAALKAMKKLF